MKINILIFVLFSILAVNIRGEDYQYAQCVFPSGSNAQGSIKLIAQNGKMNLIFALSNVTPNNGNFALSIMKYGFNPTSSKDLGGVFDNKENTAAGCPSSDSAAVFRVGDLGNIQVVDGEYSDSITGLTKPSLLFDSDANVVGRSIVIQSGSYNCATPTSNLGAIVASCVIGIGNPKNAPTGEGINVGTGNENTASGYNDTDVSLYDTMVVLRTTSIFEDGNINGQVSLAVDQSNNNTFEIAAIVNGLNKDSHGFHIHQYGDLSVSDGSTIGAHWGLSTQSHALPEAANRHYGDLGNVCIYNDDFTTAYYKFSTTYFQLGGLIGRGFAIHRTRDNGVDVGGDKVAQGVVALIPKGSSTVLVPSNWEYDVICPSGPYAGSSSTSTATTSASSSATTTGSESATTTTTSTTGEPGTSSFLTPFISLIAFTIISTIVFIF